MKKKTCPAPKNSMHGRSLILITAPTPGLLCEVRLPTRVKAVFRQKFLYIPEGAVFAKALLLLLGQTRPENSLGEDEIRFSGGAQVGIPVADVEDLIELVPAGLQNVALAGPALVACLVGVGEFDGPGLPVSFP